MKGSAKAPVVPTENLIRAVLNNLVGRILGADMSARTPIQKLFCHCPDISTSTRNVLALVTIAE
jgi:hypothetical protein